MSSCGVRGPCCAPQYRYSPLSPTSGPPTLPGTNDGNNPDNRLSVRGVLDSVNHELRAMAELMERLRTLISRATFALENYCSEAAKLPLLAKTLAALRGPLSNIGATNSRTRGSRETQEMVSTGGDQIAAHSLGVHTAQCTNRHHQDLQSRV